MSRREDLECSIRRSYALIRDYEETIRTSNRPDEIQRAQEQIDKQWGLIERYVQEYGPLVRGSFPLDIAEIAAHFPDQRLFKIRQAIAANEEVRGSLPSDRLDEIEAALDALRDQLDSIQNWLHRSGAAGAGHGGADGTGYAVGKTKTLSDAITQSGHWHTLQQAAIHAVTVGGIAAMGFYRQTGTLSDLPWPDELLGGEDKKNPSTMADLQATAAILQMLDTYLRPLAIKLNCTLSYLGEETEFRGWLQANLREDAFNALRTPDEFFTGKEDTIRVILDAIDGTVNFLHGIPLFCSGLTILVGRHVRVAAIYDPIHHVVYSGALTGPDEDPEACAEAWALEVATGNRVDLVQLANQIVHTGTHAEGIGTHLTRSNSEKLREFAGAHGPSGQSQLERLAEGFGGIYAFNSGMVALVNVARGALGAFVNNTTNLWDVAPGEVLIRACKGQVTGFDGAPIDYSAASRISVVAARSPSIHRQVLDILNTPG